MKIGVALLSFLLLTSLAHADVKPSSLDLQKRLFRVQQLMSENKSSLAYRELCDFLALYSDDSLARKRGLGFFEALLRSPAKVSLNGPAEIGKVILSFYSNWQGEVETTSLAIFQPPTGAPQWQKVHLTRKSLDGDKVFRLDTVGLGKWMSFMPYQSGLFDLLITPSAEKTPSEAHYPVIVNIDSLRPAPPKLTTRWLGNDKLSIKIQLVDESEINNAELAVIDREKNAPVGLASGQETRDFVATLQKSEAAKYQIYATHRRVYELSPVQVILETRRIVENF